MVEVEKEEEFTVKEEEEGNEDSGLVNLRWASRVSERCPPRCPWSRAGSVLLRSMVDLLCVTRLRALLSLVL